MMSETRTAAVPYRGPEPNDVEITGSPWYPEPPAPNASQESFALGDALGELVRNKWVLAVCILLGVVAGLVWTAVTPPTYRARTSVQLEGFRDGQLFSISTTSTGAPGATVDNYLQNQVKLLESDTLAKRVAARIGGQLSSSRPGRLSRFMQNFRRSIGLPEPLVRSEEEQRAAAVKRAIDVRTSLQSQVIEIFYEAGSPAVAAAGANAAAEEFIALNREARDALIKESTVWLNQQAGEMKGRLEAANRNMQQYASSAGLVFAGSDDTLAQARMRQIQEALVRAEADRADKQARYEAAMEAGKVVGGATTPDPMQQVQVDLQNMRKELSQLRTIYTPSHAKVIGLEAQIRETEQALERGRDDQITRLRNEYLAAAGLERMLMASQARELETSERQMNQQRHYEVLKSEAETNQHLYQQVLENLKTAGAASSLRSTNVHVIDEATRPAEPYSPNLPLNMSVGFALGGIGGVALVLARGRSRKVSRPGETAVLTVPELGAIPSSEFNWSTSTQRKMLPFRKKREPGLVTWTHDASPMSESFRATLNSILFGAFLNSDQNVPTTGRVLTVSSVDPMAGKTTVVSNLAVASAERKQRVLVIDCDLRRPRVHTLFGIANDWGLTNILEQAQASDFVRNAPIESLIRPTSVANVWILPAGPGTAAISGLLYSAGLRHLLQRFRLEFDMVFLDSPPLMLYSDARLLGRLSDGLVMVVRANSRTRDELRMVYSRLLGDKIRLLGSILNQWETDPRETKEYGEYYYRYQQATNRSL